MWWWFHPPLSRIMKVQSYIKISCMKIYSKLISLGKFTSFDCESLTTELSLWFLPHKCKPCPFKNIWNHFESKIVYIRCTLDTVINSYTELFITKVTWKYKTNIPKINCT